MVCDCAPYCLSPLKSVVRETDNYFLEDRMAIEMGGRQEMGMDKFHAPTDESVELQNIQNSQSPS